MGRASGKGQGEDGCPLAILMFFRIVPIASACSGHVLSAQLCLAGASAAM